MARTDSYNSTVAARTRAAQQILGDKELLAVYESKGGLPEDLHTIARSGLEAEALRQMRSGVQAASGAVTINTLGTFAEVQKEYSAVMGVVQAVRVDLAEAGADVAVVKAIDKILVNEAELVVQVVEQDGAKKRKARRSEGLEALRAEIHKDAAALLSLQAAHPALARRKVDVKRLEALRDASAALAGHFAAGASRRGAKKAATMTVRDAVAVQRKKWAACYRILSAAGRADARIAALLEAAAR